MVSGVMVVVMKMDQHPTNHKLFGYAATLSKPTQLAMTASFNILEWEVTPLKSQQSRYLRQLSPIKFSLR